VTQKMTERGQITLRKDLLQHMNVERGGQLEFEKCPDGSVKIRAARPKGSIERFFHSLDGKPNNGRKLTIEEMNEIIADGWAGKLDDHG